MTEPTAIEILPVCAFQSGAPQKKDLRKVPCVRKKGEKMTVAEKKKYLKRAYRIPDHIRSLEAECARLRQALESVGGVSDGQPRAPRHDGSTAETRTIVSVIDLEEKLDREKANLCVLWRDIHDAIEEMEDEQERDVLRYRYIEGLDWERIARKIDRDKRQALRIHGNALINFQPKT